MSSRDSQSCSEQGSASEEGDIDSMVSWIAWFCAQQGNHWLLPVPDWFIQGIEILLAAYIVSISTKRLIFNGSNLQRFWLPNQLFTAPKIYLASINTTSYQLLTADEFNMTGLASTKNYSLARDIILDLEHTLKPSELEIVEKDSKILYLFIHQRWVCSKPGCKMMAVRVQNREFGKCPRWHCGGVGGIPCGLSNDYGVSSAYLFCPRCNDIYLPTLSRNNVSFYCEMLRIYQQL